MGGRSTSGIVRKTGLMAMAGLNLVEQGVSSNNLSGFLHQLAVAPICRMSDLHLELTSGAKHDGILDPRMLTDEMSAAFHRMEKVHKNVSRNKGVSFEFIVLGAMLRWVREQRNS